MQQADNADTIGRAATSGGKCEKVSALTRRGVLAGGAVSIAALANAVPVVAARWDALGWLRRWEGLGCGAHGTRSGHPELTPRLGDAGQNRAVALLLTELAAEPSRLVRVGEALREYDGMVDNLDRDQRVLRGLRARISRQLPERPMVYQRSGAFVDEEAGRTWAVACHGIYQREVFA